MRLKPEESRKLSQHIGELLIQDPAVTLKTQRPHLIDTIEKVLVHHFDEERLIEQEAERLFASQGTESGKLERGKAMSMIRQKIATAKNYVLSGGPEGRFSQDKLNNLSHLVADRLYD